MSEPRFCEVESRILEALENACKLLGELGVEVVQCTAAEFYDYLTGETFTGDKTTLGDVLGSLYLVAHEAVEISELKMSGLSINGGTVAGSPRELIYIAHFRATDVELMAALGQGDAEWVRMRVSNHHGHLKGDEFMPEGVRGEAEALYEKYREYHVG